MVGVFDLASNVTEGIKNTTTVFEHDLDRVRLPRQVGRDGILRLYEPREALGLSWLKNMEDGRYFHETYVAHLDLRIDGYAILCTATKVIMLRIQTLRTEWEIPFSGRF